MEKNLFSGIALIAILIGLYFAWPGEPGAGVLDEAECVAVTTWVAVAQSDEMRLQIEARNVNKFLAEQPGFIMRDFAKDREGHWVEVSYWRRRADAEAAQTAMENDDRCSAFLAMIDEESVVRTNYRSVVRATAPRD